MKNLLAAIFAVMMVIGLPGCSTSSQRAMSDEAVGEYLVQIAGGKKPMKSDVRKNLGEPLSITSASEGEVWTYRKFTITFNDEKLKYLYMCGLAACRT